jgi:hypothetical protein
MTRGASKDLLCLLAGARVLRRAHVDPRWHCWGFQRPLQALCFFGGGTVDPARSLSHRRQAGRRAVGLSKERPGQSPVDRVWGFCVRRRNGRSEFTKRIYLASIWEGPWVRDRQRYAFPVGRCLRAEGRAGVSRVCPVAGDPRRCQRGDVPITSTNARAILPRRPSAPMTVAVTS